MPLSPSSSPVVWLKRSKENGKLRTLDENQTLELEATWRAGKKEKTINSESVRQSNLCTIFFYT